MIASDIAAFREIASPDLKLLSPLDGDAWLEEIAAFCARPRETRAQPVPTPPWSDYFAKLEAFLEAL